MQTMTEFPVHSRRNFRRRNHEQTSTTDPTACGLSATLEMLGSDARALARTLLRRRRQAP